MVEEVEFGLAGEGVGGWWYGGGLGAACGAEAGAAAFRWDEAAVPAALFSVASAL